MAGTVQSGEASLRSQNVSAPQLMVCLKGMDFPADKKAILDHARSTDCPQRVVNYLNRIPNREYGRVTEIEKEFGKIK